MYNYCGHPYLSQAEVAIVTERRGPLNENGREDLFREATETIRLGSTFQVTYVHKDHPVGAAVYKSTYLRNPIHFVVGNFGDSSVQVLIYKDQSMIRDFVLTPHKKFEFLNWPAYATEEQLGFPAGDYRLYVRCLGEDESFCRALGLIGFSG